MTIRCPAIISIGSNIGDKAGNCRRAIAALEGLEDTRVLDIAKMYRTAPVDYLDQDWFLNTAVRIETGLDPHALLAALQRIQRDLGRKADTVRFGPRVIDLDIIFYGDAVIDTPGLVIPHPRMHKRRFVLVPICDIDPRIVHPVLMQPVKTLLDRIADDNQVVEAVSCDC
jgi:2-amino-4-hydroxy-6-hydroxymethyldihydropteridine diphosphokinase